MGDVSYHATKKCATIKWISDEKQINNYTLSLFYVFMFSKTLCNFKKLVLIS